MTAPEAWFVTRTMRAIELVAFEPCSASQVADALQIHPRTARRLLTRLVDEGYLVRREGERRTYAPSLRIVALAAQVVERSELARAARPFVERLHGETGVAAHLMAPSYRSALCLAHCASAGDVRPQLRELVPAHCTASGKVLLAHRGPWRRSVLGEPLHRHTDRTLTEPDALEQELGRVRDRGCAIEDGEYQEGVRAVATPVRDEQAEVVAALGVAGVADELAPERLLPLANVVRETAFELSRALGFSDRDAEAEPTRAAGHG